jgi:hypothetical protein
MNDQEHSHSSENRPPAEVHREREVIVTNGGGRRSGAGGAVLVIVALVAVVVLGFLAYTFLERDGGDIIPGDIDVNIQVPEVEGDS